MKRLTKYIILLFAVAFASCEKAGFISEEIELFPHAGYIRFSTGVKTKAPIIDNMKSRNFGVLGYEYGMNTNWQTASPLATPETFYNQEIVCSDQGVCSYDAYPTDADKSLKPWELSKKYSFFAYFPYCDKNKSEEEQTVADKLLTVSASNQVNTPRVTYSLPFGTGYLDSDGMVNPDNLLDLMTASSIDQTAGAGMVSFTFQHRLFCVEVVGQNFNDVDETISNLSVSLNNLSYKGISVPMHSNDTNLEYTPNDLGAISFRLLNASESILLPSYGKTSGAISLAGPNKDRMLMLVPQNASKVALEGSVTFNLSGDEGPQSKSFSANLNFREGRKYTLSINITGESIVVVASEAEAWEQIPVGYEFE